MPDMIDGLHIQRSGIPDIGTIRAMADVVFRKTYRDILSPEQMEFMMEWMYGEESLREQVCGKGKTFCIARDGNGEPCGYVSFETEGTLPDGRPLYHLQKLYVMPSHQGRGLGKALLESVRNTLSERHPDGWRFELNVNRENPAVGFYERMGLIRVRQGDFPIGHGFYMNDYIYADEAGAR